MSDSQDTHGHEGPIKTPRQLIWTVVAAFVVPIMVIVLLVNFVATAPRPGAGSDLHSAEAVARRLMPVARIELAGAAPDAAAASAQPGSASPAEAQAPASGASASAAAPTAAPQAAATTAASAPADVPAVYTRSCASCHRSGVAGAPKLGDSGAWAPRAATGIEALTASVIKGKGAMPPRGTARGASDAELRAAV
ncbi:MAG TPA: c-type cytochrome, partial [Rubrivivax sp.]|nr:c-type cytochrome [Rubrivivax sp.]